MIFAIWNEIKNGRSMDSHGQGLSTIHMDFFHRSTIFFISTQSYNLWALKVISDRTIDCLYQKSMRKTVVPSGDITVWNADKNLHKDQICYILYVTYNMHSIHCTILYKVCIVRFCTMIYSRQHNEFQLACMLQSVSIDKNWPRI